MRPVRFPPCAAGARPMIKSLAPTGPKLGTGRPQYFQSRKRLTLSRATVSRYSTSRGHRQQLTISFWANNLAILNGHRPAAWKKHRLISTRDNTHRRRSELAEHLASRHTRKNRTRTGKEWPWQKGI